MSIMSSNCVRCGANKAVTTMSWFNFDIICMNCAEEERKHPRFREAIEAEHAAVRAGNYNFPGIGFSDTNQ